jgi:hypothetical protein
MARTRLFWTISWLVTGWIVWEFLYYEQFKLNAAEGSVEGVFLPLARWIGMPALEPQLRWGVALLEIAASVLLLNQPTRAWGAGMAAGILGGAIFLHVLGPIGIDPYNDGAQLFREAVTCFALSLFLLWWHREELPSLLARPLGARA